MEGRRDGGMEGGMKEGWREGWTERWEMGMGNEAWKGRKEDVKLIEWCEGRKVTG